MIALLLALAPAWADPIALRAPQSRVVASIGLPDTSVGAWLSPHLGLSAEYHPYSAAGVSVGWRQDLVRGDSGLGVEVGVAGGPMLTWLDPGLVLAISPTVQAGWAGKGLDAKLGVVAPAALRLAPGAGARVPLLGELWLGGRLGALRLGGHLGAGTTWVIGAPGEIAYDVGLDVGFGRLP